MILITYRALVKTLKIKLETQNLDTKFLHEVFFSETLNDLSTSDYLFCEHEKVLLPGPGQI